MNKCLLLGFSVLVLSTVAQGLVCKVCKFKFGGVCYNSDDPCRAEHGQFCETTKVYSGHIRLFTKYGCTKSAELCNTTERRDNVFDMSYNRTCCDSDLCNGGVVSNPSFPLLAGLGMALGWWVAH
ncbi:lymphocyte antigen 6 complex locus protein G6c [Anolis carolinensis]|uniref:lymphocyte antigen 6 complex locus protein G6c n=1 Tax=Anolis carolinensis TaxID=28377 RepID=UPI000203AB89|nr:PREDICTED: lymphocyte antigen 6 complex locus protein G6c [Anolis carolinensis]|eukprot:XP_008119928.1 PREDICTED: lymphocyte antigen 6 complex locus protein G6c [Anolis carolinensis]